MIVGFRFVTRARLQPGRKSKKQDSQLSLCNSRPPAIPTPMNETACPILSVSLYLADRFSLARQAFWGGAELDFQGMAGLSLRCLFWPDEDFSSGLWFIVRMSPPSYPSAWLLPSRARFRFTWCGDCSAYGIPSWGKSLRPS